jgi:hypothetical protein
LQLDETLLAALCAIGDRVQKQYVIQKVVISRATCWRYGFVSLPGNDCEDADIPGLIEATQPLAHLVVFSPALEVPKPPFTYPGPTVEARDNKCLTIAEDRMLVSDDNLSHSVKLSRRGAIGLCSGDAAILKRLMTFFGLEGPRIRILCQSYRASAGSTPHLSFEG